MRSTDHLTREQLRRLLFRQRNPEEIAEKREAHDEARWLLAFNLSPHEPETTGSVASVSDEATPERRLVENKRTGALEFRRMALQSSNAASRHENQRPSATRCRRYFIHEFIESLREAYKNLCDEFVAVEIVGAGVALTSSASRSYSDRIRLSDAVDVDIELEWSDESLTLRCGAGPEHEGIMIFFFENPVSRLPRASLEISTRDLVEELAITVTREELGFDPTTDGWQLRLALV